MIDNEKPKLTVNVGFRADKELLEKLHKLSFQQDRSISYITRKLVEKALSEGFTLPE